MAAVRAALSCTRSFHHRGTQTQRKNKNGRMKMNHLDGSRDRSGALHAGALLGSTIEQDYVSRLSGFAAWGRDHLPAGPRSHRTGRYLCFLPGRRSGDLRNSRSVLPLPLVAEIDHLADVVLHMGGALDDHVEAVERVGANAGIVGGPVLRRLRGDGSDDHGDGVGEAFERFVCRRRIRVGEFTRAVADVASLRNLCADVVIQVAREVEDQVAETVSEGEGPLPELGFGQGRGNSWILFAFAVYRSARTDESVECKSVMILFPKSRWGNAIPLPGTGLRPAGQPRAAVPTRFHLSPTRNHTTLAVSCFSFSAW